MIVTIHTNLYCVRDAGAGFAYGGAYNNQASALSTAQLYLVTLCVLHNVTKVTTSFSPQIKQSTDIVTVGDIDFENVIYILTTFV